MSVDKSDNNHNTEVRVDRARIISYDDSDPRYDLNIEDSDEYTRNIYPLHFSKKCHDSKEYENLIKYDYPLVSRCWGERYEHCAVMKKYGKNCNSQDSITRPVIEAGSCSCARCAMNLYGPIEDTLGYARIDLTHNSNEASHKEELNRSDFKEQNRSTAYDKTRIFKSDGLEINRHEPDVKTSGSNLSVNKVGNGLEYNLELEDKYAYYKPNSLSDQTIEPFVADIAATAGEGLGTAFESCLGICLPGDVANKWGYATLCSAVCGLFLCCMVMNAFIPGLGFLKQPPVPSYACIAAIVIMLVCGCSTYSFFQDSDNVPDFLEKKCS
jgi:hypothetical protein